MDIVTKLRINARAPWAVRYEHDGWINDAAAEIERQKAVIDWVESWVHNPVGSYSVSALDGLFAMTRDKITSLRGKS